jgi:hypothetical protein
MRRAPIAAALILAGLTAAPSRADWLVTRQGGRVETKGPWKIKGKLVVFTDANGTLASLRLADVDIPASEEATAEAVEAAAKAAEPPPPQPEKKKESVLVVTDETLRKATAPPPPPEGAAPAAPEKKKAGSSVVVVDNWRQVRRAEGDGLEILGTLRNTTSDLVAEAGVLVKLYDDNGKLLATAEGLLSMPSIKPDSSTSFRASFPGLFAFAKAEFETKGYGVKMDTPKEGEAPSTPDTAAPPPDRAP